MTVLQLLCPYDCVSVRGADERSMGDEMAIFTEAAGSIFNHDPPVEARTLRVCPLDEIFPGATSGPIGQKRPSVILEQPTKGRFV
jgi:hypothetical protein